MTVGGRQVSVGQGKGKGILQGTLALGAASFLTAVFFLLLPWLVTMGRKPQSDTELRQVGAVVEAPPPPEAPPQPEEEKKEEPPPPELQENAPPLDLAQLEMALNPDALGGGDAFGGEFAAHLSSSLDQQITGAAGGADGVFSSADLERQPQVINQPLPEYPPELRRKKIKGVVHVIFQVDKQGRVLQPIVQQTTHPAFSEPALQAVKRWRFEPGMRGGKPVVSRMRVPISFSAG